MIVYFDMDGVLTDLNGMLAKKAGVERSAMADPAFRSEWIHRSLAEDQAAHWRDIPANRLKEFKAAMGWLRRIKGHDIEILTSYGQATLADCGAKAHAGKVGWLTAHYLEEFQERLITRFNGVQSCWQKKFFATPGSLLIDDQAENVEQWRSAGGVAILYDLEHHARFPTELEQALQELR